MGPDKAYMLPLYHQLTDHIDIQDPEILRRWIADQVRDQSFYGLIWDAISSYVSELKVIFTKCPRISHTTTVFRGTESFYYGNAEQNIFTTGDFTSTTLSPDTAIRFAGEGCCFTRFKLKPDTPVIFMGSVSQHPAEIEMLLPLGIRFKRVSSRVQKWVDASIPDFIGNDPKELKAYICHNSGDDMRITVMEGI